MFEKSPSINYDVLRTIRSLFAPFEVRTRSPSDWQHTILEGFKVWRSLIDHGGGTVIANSETSTMSFEPPTWKA